MSNTIYKVLTREQWAAACEGAALAVPVDVHDGYVHFSTAETLQGTLDKWFQGADGAVLLVFDASVFGSSLRWEPARGGALFPHVYAAVYAQQAKRTLPLEMGPNGAPLAPLGLE